MEKQPSLKIWMMSHSSECVPPRLPLGTHSTAGDILHFFIWQVATELRSDAKYLIAFSHIVYAQLWVYSQTVKSSYRWSFQTVSSTRPRSQILTLASSMKAPSVLLTVWRAGLRGLSHIRTQLPYLSPHQSAAAVKQLCSKFALRSDSQRLCQCINFLIMSLCNQIVCSSLSCDTEPTPYLTPQQISCVTFVLFCFFHSSCIVNENAASSSSYKLALIFLPTAKSKEPERGTDAKVNKGELHLICEAMKCCRIENVLCWWWIRWPSATFRCIICVFARLRSQNWD